MQVIYKNNLTEHLDIYVFIILLFSFIASGQQDDANWNQFRGPNGQGVSLSDSIPAQFGPETNVLWKTEIGIGHSSPVIYNNRIFLTTLDPADKNELNTVCIDRNSGKILWRRSVRSQTKVRYHSMNNAAASTPAVDDKHVYVYFGTYGLLCYDHEGNQLWHRNLETPKSQYGMSTSPILYEDNVILVLDDNGGKSHLLAVNRQTGVTAWKQPRSMFRAGWSTPMIWRHGDTDELVVLGYKRLTSYNASNGEELWWAGGFSKETVGVPITAEGLLFASSSAMAGRGDGKWDANRLWKITLDEFDKNDDNEIHRDEMTKGFTIPIRPELARDNPGYGLPVWDMDGLLRFIDKDKDKIIKESDWMKTMSGFAKESEPTLLAIRPGAKDDARQSHIAWETHRGLPETSSLLYCQGKLYLLRDGGLLTCVEASTGKELFRERIDAPGQYMASPVAAGDRIIFASYRGIVTVIQADEKLNILAKNNFREKIYATPAIADNKIYLRTKDNLYAIGR